MLLGVWGKGGACCLEVLARNQNVIIYQYNVPILEMVTIEVYGASARPPTVAFANYVTFVKEVVPSLHQL